MMVLKGENIDDGDWDTNDDEDMGDMLTVAGGDDCGGDHSEAAVAVRWRWQ